MKASRRAAYFDPYDFLLALVIDLYTQITMFADNIAVSPSGPNRIIASNKIKNHFNHIEQWTKKWMLNVNETRSQQETSALRHQNLPVVIKNALIINNDSKMLKKSLVLLPWKPPMVKTRHKMKKDSTS